MSSLNPKPEIGWFVRSLVGIGVAAAGLVAVTVLTHEWITAVRYGDPSVGLLIGLTAMFGPVACFAVIAGLRFMLNRPNEYGAIMGPFGWKLCALLIVLICAGLIVEDAHTGSGLAWMLLSLLPIAGACAVKAQSLVKRGRITWSRPRRNGLD